MFGVSGDYAAYENRMPPIPILPKKTECIYSFQTFRKEQGYGMGNAPYLQF